MIFDKIRAVYRWATVPPEGVERAPRRERIKRDAWMILSTVLAFAAGFVIVAVVGEVVTRLFGIPDPSGFTAAAIITGSWVVVSVLIDIRLFAWGVRAFEIVPPWQFRVPVEVAD